MSELDMDFLDEFVTLDNERSFLVNIRDFIENYLGRMGNDDGDDSPRPQDSISRLQLLAVNITGEVDAMVKRSLLVSDSERRITRDRMRYRLALIGELNQLVDRAQMIRQRFYGHAEIDVACSIARLDHDLRQMANSLNDEIRRLKLEIDYHEAYRKMVRDSIVNLVRRTIRNANLHEF